MEEKSFIENNAKFFNDSMGVVACNSEHEVNNIIAKCKNKFQTVLTIKGCDDKAKALELIKKQNIYPAITAGNCIPVFSKLYYQPVVHCSYSVNAIELYWKLMHYNRRANPKYLETLHEYTHKPEWQENMRDTAIVRLSGAQNSNCSTLCWTPSEETSVHSYDKLFESTVKGVIKDRPYLMSSTEIDDASDVAAENCINQMLQVAQSKFMQEMGKRSRIEEDGDWDVDFYKYEETNPKWVKTLVLAPFYLFDFDVWGKPVKILVDLVDERVFETTTTALDYERARAKEKERQEEIKRQKVQEKERLKKQKLEQKAAKKQAKIDKKLAKRKP